MYNAFIYYKLYRVFQFIVPSNFENYFMSERMMEMLNKKLIFSYLLPFLQLSTKGVRKPQKLCNKYRGLGNLISVKIKI